MEHRRSRLSRRAFVLGAAILLLSGVALMLGVGSGWLHAGTPAQQPPRPARIGLLLLSPPGSNAGPLSVGDALEELGYVTGRDLVFMVRSAMGDAERLPALAAELVALPVDVLVAIAGTQGNLAAREATSTIPIVMSFNGDPVATGVVASWARPGGNLTGIAGYSAELNGKRVQLLREALPEVSRVAVLLNPGNPAQEISVRATTEAASALGLWLQFNAVRRLDDLEPALQDAANQRPDALLPLDDAVLNAGQARIAEFAAQRGLPTMFNQRRAVEDGGLMAYVENLADRNRRVAYYVDRILKGTKPADLPVERPTRFDFVVNLRTARELGITFPNEIMLQVTEVIQ
jgi:putative tryptophan/tyrosine transport system substrate-binding protein